MQKSIWSVICGALLLARSLVYAQEDVDGWAVQEDVRDLVVLTGGNRLHGEIVELARGELTFSIDGAGPVGIDWRNVVTLTSGRSFDVELTSGARLSGPILSPSHGLLAVAVGTASAAFEMHEVVRITPLAATPAERTSGYVDLGFYFLSANEELNLTLNFGARNLTRNYSTVLSLDTIVSELDGETANRRNYLQIRSRRLLARRWFIVGRLHLEEDLKLDLDSRVLIGIGGGRTLVQSNRTALAVYGGFAGDRERYRRISGTDITAEAFVTVEWDWFELGGETQLSTIGTTYFSFDRSRQRVELAASLRRSIAGNMYWSVRVYESYDSDPPPGFENSDLGVALSIGRSF